MGLQHHPHHRRWEYCELALLLVNLEALRRWPYHDAHRRNLGLIGLTILELSFGVTNPVFIEASVFCYMYLFFIFIPHGFAMMGYFRRFAPKDDEEAVEDKAAELVES